MFIRTCIGTLLSMHVCVFSSPSLAILLLPLSSSDRTEGRWSHLHLSEWDGVLFSFPAGPNHTLKYVHKSHLIIWATSSGCNNYGRSKGRSLVVWMGSQLVFDPNVNQSFNSFITVAMTTKVFIVQRYRMSLKLIC